MSTSVETKSPFLQNLDEAFTDSTQEFARAFYLFATARLKETYNSQEIYDRYPLLTDVKTFEALKALYDQNPTDEETKRLFTSVLGSYLGNQLAGLSDKLQNEKHQLAVDVRGLALQDTEGKPLESILYEDTYEWLKKIPQKATRETLYNRMATAYTEKIAPLFLEHLEKEIELFKNLGYTDLVDFYSQTSGHNLPELGRQGKALVEQTNQLYQQRIAAYYEKRTGESFSKAVRADIAYVFNGPDEEMVAINRLFPEARLVEHAQKTFDGLGLAFSQVAQTVDFPSLNAYTAVVDDPKAATARRILLDIAPRTGKRSRAYVYPAKVPSEIYLSVKPEGGLDDYSAFFHESGHALHFAYESPQLSYAMAQLGNNTVTESYAYLFQNLFLNRHWLQHQAGLSEAEALQVVRRGALNDLYMLRRYASKMQFELALFDGTGLSGKGDCYAGLLTTGTGFTYDAKGWVRDVDAGFYVADYLTAWMLEAQLRAYLATHFGNPAHQGEDWYRSPDAGGFLKNLWNDGNLTQQDLAQRLGYKHPTDITPLLHWMRYNLGE